MTTQFSVEGFDDLRVYMRDNWNWIALVDDGGIEHLRWDVLNHDQVTMTDGPLSNPLTVELTVYGSDLVDAGSNLPVTLAKTEAYKTSGSTTPMGEDTYSTGTFESEKDRMIITHNYRMPR